MEKYSAKKAIIYFFEQEIEKINSICNNEISQYVYSILNKEDVTIDKNKIESFIRKNNCSFYELSVIYNIMRFNDIFFSDFFDTIKMFSSKPNVNFDKSFLFDGGDDLKYLKEIRQCRPDKNNYKYKELTNIGFYNKNKDFVYNCYSNESAEFFLEKELGKRVLDAYKSLNLPQAKSDFFLVASQYIYGGISADVCAVAQSNIGILIGDSDFCVVTDNSGLNKKFFYSNKNNKFLEQYLLFLVEECEKFNGNIDYHVFSSKESFHKNFLDFCALNNSWVEQSKIIFIPDNLFQCFVEIDMSEEFLSEEQGFTKTNLRGTIKDNITSNHALSDKIIFKKSNFYMPSSTNVILVGEDKIPNITVRSQIPYSLANLNVWDVKDVFLTGHACLWKDDSFLSFDSYLSSVSENETRAGHWMIPCKENLTDVIENECIVAFSPGYGCYGHYLVDDLPRIGLIRDCLGDAFLDKKFIISHLTPQWGKDILKFFFNIKDENFIVFNHEKDVWHLKKVYLSSYPSKNYNFHPYIKEFYASFSKKNIAPFRRICLSRKKWEKTKQNQRIFENQSFFEEVASSRGFDLVCPENMSIEKQIELMSEVSCQVGEHGSAQHASVYNQFGMIIGTINPLTEVQVGIGRIYNDRNIICYSETEYRDNNNNFYYNMPKEKILAFFDEIEREEERRANLFCPELLYKK